MKNFLLFLFTLFSTILSAQNIIESCKSGQPLIDAVRELYTPDSTLGYGPARDTLYSQIDNDGLNLSGIYTDFTVTLEEGADPSISAFQNERGLNAEHVYPQSRGARDEPGRSDMHNLYPSKVDVNSARGSCIFGEIDDEDTEFWFILGETLNQIPNSNIDAYSEKDEESCVFEPRESVKGDIARAVFYFYTIYQDKAEEADASFFPKQKDVLLAWHQSDPVSEKEIQRNELIASYQGNLNPFTVDTTLARRAFFQDDGIFEEGDANCVVTNVEEITHRDWVKLSSNSIRHGENIHLTTNEKAVKLLLVNTNGQAIRRKIVDYHGELALQNQPSGYYFLLAQKEGKQQVFKIIIY
ncbi:MAG: endonuclease [Bacteroidota bacterium]